MKSTRAVFALAKSRLTQPGVPCALFFPILLAYGALSTVLSIFWEPVAQSRAHPNKP